VTEHIDLVERDAAPGHRRRPDRLGRRDRATSSSSAPPCTRPDASPSVVAFDRHDSLVGLTSLI
jgi:hypothetical protein